MIAQFLALDWLLPAVCLDDMGGDLYLTLYQILLILWWGLYFLVVLIEFLNSDWIVPVISLVARGKGLYLSLSQILLFLWQG